LSRVQLIAGAAVGTRAVSEVEALLKRHDVLIWADIPECSEEAILG